MNQADKRRGEFLLSLLGLVELDIDIPCVRQCNENCGEPCKSCGHDYGRHSFHVYGPCQVSGCKCQGYTWGDLQETIDQVKEEFGLRESN